MGMETSRKTLSQILTFSGLTLSASEETVMMTIRASRSAGRSSAWTG